MLVPEGDQEKFRKLGFKHIYAQNWWKTTTIPVERIGEKGELKITAVPSNHWSGQGVCDDHHSTVVGYVIHQKDGDIYFAGDTARLSEEHIETLRNRFNIKNMFQPGGPDEARKNMEGTHQASVDALWMHFNLIVKRIYSEGKFQNRSKADFIERAKRSKTLFMHTKTYKLGNLHFSDTDDSVNRLKTSFRNGRLDPDIRSYEKKVYDELVAFGKGFVFTDGSHLSQEDILSILDASVIIPKIGSRTTLI
jgi:hypothetical protein